MDDRERFANGVVAAMMDGTRRKGFVYDLSPDRDEFHLYFTRDMSDAAAETIRLRDCKVICFVKSLSGNPDYRENKTELGRKKGFGRPYEVVFKDGEILRGTVESLDPNRLGFYLVPPDPKSNNERVFVVQANARSVRLLSTFGTGDADTAWETPDPVRYPGSMRVDLVTRILRGKDIRELASECYLPAAVLAHWRLRYLEGGVAALREEDPPPPEEGFAPGRRRPLRFPPARRVEAVLRVVLQEDPSVVSQVFLAPLHLMTEWRDRFLEAGRARLEEEARAEEGAPADLLRGRYEEAVRTYRPEDGTPEAILRRFLG